MRHDTSHLSSPRNRAFTLVELLVVMAIIVIGLSTMLPAFSRIIASQNFSSAVNSVTATLGNARALAIANGEPTGVAFLYDLERDRMSLQVLELEVNQATLDDPFTGYDGQSVADKEGAAMRPALGTVPVALPPRTGVFGLSFQLPRGRDNQGRPRADQTFDKNTNQPFSGSVIGGDRTNEDEHIIPWIFPRNDPRLFTPGARPNDRIGEDPWRVLRGEQSSLAPDEAKLALRHACTFAVFFNPDGTAVQRVRFQNWEYLDSYIEYPEEPYSLAPDGDREPYDNPRGFDPQFFGAPQVPEDERRPNPEVLLRGAEMLAVVDLAALASGVGMSRAWLARTETDRITDRVNGPPYLENAGLIDDDVVRDVSRWIDRNAEIITFNRYTGNVLRRTAQ
jgi:prepilin-type N-terminal cleavage/methylation domain-containing protein